MRCRSHHDPGVTALLLSGLHLRNLARLEFMYGNMEEGIFLSQLALDLRILADGSPLDCTAMWRAIVAQHPTVFRKSVQRKRRAA
jgi:hypothetical protein